MVLVRHFLAVESCYFALLFLFFALRVASRRMLGVSDRIWVVVLFLTADSVVIKDIPPCVGSLEACLVLCSEEV